MRVDYDKEADAKYFALKRGKIVKTESIEDWLNFDLAGDHSVIGIEILDASQHNIGISTIGDEFIGYFETQPASVRISEFEIPKLQVPEERISYKGVVTG